MYSWIIGLTLFQIIYQHIVLDYNLYLESELIGVLISTCSCVGVDVDQQENPNIPENKLAKIIYLGFGMFLIYYGLKHATGTNPEKLLELLPEVEKITEATPAATPTLTLSKESLFQTESLKILGLQPIINFCFDPYTEFSELLSTI